MQQHLNGFDCDVYAIAYATDIPFDRDPASQEMGKWERRKWENIYCDVCRGVI